VYLASLLNDQNLFQRLNGWVALADGSAQQLRQAKAQDLYFRATSVLIAMDRIAELDQACVREFAQFESETDVKDDRIVFWSPPLVALLNEVPSALSSLRIMQNSVLPVFATGHGRRITVPSRLSDAIKRLHTLGLSAQFKARVLQYWQAHGKDLKQYRDLDQHFAVVVRHTFLRTDEPRRVLVLLPDNPEGRSPESFTYEREVDALDFVRGAFMSLHQLYEDLATIEGATPRALQQAVDMAQLGKLEEGVSKTLALIVESAPEGQALILGQTEDRRATVKRVPPPSH
jgi:hypothetical protein